MMLETIRYHWRIWRRPKIDWSQVKTIEMRMAIHPASVARAMNELNAEKRKLVRARNRLTAKKRKARR